MKVIRILVLVGLISAQNSYGAASSGGAPQQAQETVTLKCTDGVIEQVPKEILVQNFGFFRTLFEARGRGLGRSTPLSSAIEVDGTVEDMTYLLSLVSSDYAPVGGKRPSEFSILVLANYLEVDSEIMALLQGLYNPKLQQALYSSEGYEQFLSGDSVPFSTGLLLSDDNRPLVADSGIKFFRYLQDVWFNPKALLVQSDGKIIVGGDETVHSDQNKRFRLVRYNTDRTIDTSFGMYGNGIALAEIKETTLYPQMTADWLFGSESRQLSGGLETLVATSDGGCIAMGTVHVQTWNHDYQAFNGFLVVKFDRNGRLDESFGSNGYGFIDFIENNLNQQIAVAHVNPDGSLLAAGPAGGYEIVFAQWLPNGQKNRLFTGGLSGGTGVVTIKNDPALLFHVPSKLLTQSDGKTVGVFSPYSKLGTGGAVLKRLNVDGSIDTDFGAGGLTVLFPDDFFTYVTAVQPAGAQNILVAGCFAGINEEGNHWSLGLVSCPAEGFTQRQLAMENAKILPVTNSGEFQSVFNPAGTLLAIYSSKWISLYSSDGENVFSLQLDDWIGNETIKNVAFSPSGSLIVQYSGTSAFLEIKYSVERIKENALLSGSGDEEHYLYRALKSRVEHLGHALDELSLPAELDEMFDRLPQELQDGILSVEGKSKRQTEKLASEAEKNRGVESASSGNPLGAEEGNNRELVVPPIPMVPEDDDVVLLDDPVHDADEDEVLVLDEDVHSVIPGDDEVIILDED